MQLFKLYGVYLFLFSRLAHPTAAAVSACEIGDVPADVPIVVSTQEELQAAIPANCTEIVGSITIAQDYTGPFTLNGITYFEGSIASADNNSLAYTEAPDGHPPILLTSFEMQDLLYMGRAQYYSGISLANVPALTSINIPKATYMGSIQIGNFSQASFDFSSLVNATWIEITGGSISSLLLPSLVSVERYLDITSYSSSHAPRLDIEFPALTDALSIAITANLSRLSMPLLSQVTGGVLPYSSSDDTEGGLSVNNLDNSGSTVAMIFPQLQATNVTKFSGAIASIVLPSLNETQGDIYITASEPLAVNLTNLESVHDLILTGNISSINFPALTYVNNLDIESQLPLNCTPATTAYETAWNLHGSNSTNNTYISAMSCHSTTNIQAGGGHKLSTNAKIGIALGVGVASLGALTLLYFWFLAKKKESAAKGVIGEGEIELDERDLREPPPDYDSVMATEVGSLRSEWTAVQLAEGGESEHRDLEDVHREGQERGAVDDGDVSPVTPVERDAVRV